MNITAATVFSGLAVATLITGCASTAPSPKPEPPPSQQIDPTSGASDEVTVGRTASGEIVSLDGKTTGRVEVELRKNGEGDFGQEYNAQIKILDLQTPYSTLGVRGSYWQRQDDRCADTGFQSGDFEVGGAQPIVAAMAATWTWGTEDWQVDPQDVNVDAARGDTALLHEVALTRNAHMQESDGELVDLLTCQNLVVAHAVLNWDPVQ